MVLCVCRSIVFLRIASWLSYGWAQKPQKSATLIYHMWYNHFNSNMPCFVTFSSYFYTIVANHIAKATFTVPFMCRIVSKKGAVTPLCASFPADASPVFLRRSCFFRRSRTSFTYPSFPCIPGDCARFRRQASGLFLHAAWTVQLLPHTLRPPHGTPDSETLPPPFPL